MTSLTAQDAPPAPQTPSRPTLAVAFLVYPGFQIQDLSSMLAPFEVAESVAQRAAYQHHIVSLSGGLVRSSGGLDILTEKIRIPSYDTLFVVGGALSLSASLVSALSEQLKAAFEQGTRRIVSASTGSFLLAEAGLLDRRLVTTHWKYAIQLQRKFPKARVDGNRIFANDNGVWTSAGVTAGIDLALALIEEDLGSKVADLIAQLLVAYRRRPGCQMQYAAIDDVRPQSAPIRATLAYMRENSHLPISTEKLSIIANLSPRQFGRMFLAETGETPAKTLERLRVDAARARLENSNDAIEIIATRTGFGDAERMRKAFIRVTGHPPQSIRRLANCHAQNHTKS